MGASDWRDIADTVDSPRQTAMAAGKPPPMRSHSRSMPCVGSLTNGIVSNPFLEQAFRTDRYTIGVDIYRMAHGRISRTRC